MMLEVVDCMSSLALLRPPKKLETLFSNPRFIPILLLLVPRLMLVLLLLLAPLG